VVAPVAACLEVPVALVAGLVVLVATGDVAVAGFVVLVAAGDVVVAGFVVRILMLVI
jgi:hypothetical protein